MSSKGDTMDSVNSVNILGRVGNDPEFATTKSGLPQCKFSVATNEKMKEEEITEWHRIVVWGKLAEICQEYIKKGSAVFVEGKLKTSKYKLQNEATNRFSTNIIGKKVVFIGNPAQKEQDEQGLPF